MRNNITFSTIGMPAWKWMMHDFDDLLEQTFHESSMQRTQSVIPYDVVESESGYLVTVDLPGVRKEDVNLEVVDQTLTVSGQRKRINSEEGDRFFCRFTIPQSADSTRVEARMENGVLEIALPKVEAAKPKSIQIQTGEQGLFTKLLGSKKEKKPTEAQVT